METSGCLDDDTIAELLARALAPDQITRVEAHLDTCGDCRRHLSDLLRQPKLAAGSSPEQPEVASGARTLGGRYRVLRSIGRGGMGEVFAAFDPELGRTVAVKLMHHSTDGADGARLRREAQAMARLAHPNVVSIYDVGIDGARVFAAMELVEGATLAAWARTRSTAEILEACIQAGRGLAAAHAVGLVHRDVTPRNVLVGDDGRARMSDFGLVRLAAEESQPASPIVADTPLDQLTMTGQFVGTPAYAPPEAFDARPVDERGDQWSFAATTWHAVFGQRPFAGNTFSDLATAVAAGRLDESTERRLPRRARAALVRAMSVDPAARFASMESLLAELAPRPRARRWVGVVAASAAVVIGLLVARPSEPSTCATPINRVWTADDARTVARAFGSATEQFARVDRAFTNYIAEAARLSVAGCALGSELRAMRERCLSQRLVTIGALRDELVKPLDTSAIDAAVVAVASLPALDSCTDVMALTRGTHVEDPELRARFARIDALQQLGHYSEELAEANAAVARARTPVHAASLGDALYRLGGAQDDGGDGAAARITLEEAGRVAATAHDDLGVAKTWLLLLELVASEQGDVRDAIGMLPIVAAAIARAGDRGIDARFLAVESEVLEGVGRMDEARRDGQQAVERLIAVVGADSLDVAKARGNLATLLYARREYVEGHAVAKLALATFEALLGSNHPDVAAALASEGHAYADEQRWPEAEAALARALAIEERALGPDHLEVAETERDLAHMWFARGEWAKARASYERALPSFERATGAESGDVGNLVANIGITLVHDGRCDDARPWLERGIAAETAALGATNVRIADAMTYLAECLATAGRRTDAIALAERALALHGDHDDPIEVADREFRVAQILGSLQPVRARALAIAARDGYAAAGRAPDLARVADWLSRVDVRN